MPVYMKLDGVDGKISSRPPSAQSGPADEGPEESITFVYSKIGDTFDFKLTTEPTTGEDWLAEDHFKVDSSDPSVDPNNPNAEVHHSEFSIVKLTDVATPKVVDDGLLLPAVQDDGLLLPAVQTDDAFDFATKPTAPEPYMEWKLKEVMISGYQMSHADGDGGIIIDYTPGPDDNALAVDPSDPNTDVDGRDFLAWQKRPVTPGPDDNVTGLPAVQKDDGLLLPAVQDDGLLLPAVQTGDVALPGLPMTGNGNPDSFDFQPQFTTDDGLLLPAVQDDGLLLPAVQDDGLLLPAVKLDDGSHLLHPDLM